MPSGPKNVCSRSQVKPSQRNRPCCKVLAGWNPFHPKEAEKRKNTNPSRHSCKSMTGSNVIAAMGVLVVGLITSGCNSQHAATPPALPEVAIVTVSPERTVLTTELPGRTSAYLVADIRPQVTGIIQKRLFEEGSDVRAGKVLYQIDPAPFQAAYDNAAANLSGMRKAAERARAGLEVSVANVVKQRSTLELARTNRWRYEELNKKSVISVAQRDQAVTDFEVAEATLRANEAQVKNDQEVVAVAETAIQQAEAAIESARISLGYTQVVAPITGRIGKSNVTVGGLVSAGGPTQQPTALTTIQQIDPIYVDVPQSTADLLRLRRRVEEGSLHNSGENQSKVRLILEDGTTYPHGRNASVPRRHRGLDDRVLHSAGDRSQSKGPPSAGHVPPRRGAGGYQQ